MLGKVLIYFFILFFSLSVYAFPTNSIYNLDLKLVDKSGKVLNLHDLSGKVQILSMIYTNCKTICPIIIANMKAIERIVLLEKFKNINFSLISLDPDRDSVDILSKFFNDKKMDSSRWNLYKTSKEDTLKLALTLGIKYKKEKNNEYTHSNLIIILDKQGVIKMHHQGLDKNFDHVIKLLSQLD